MKTRILIIMLWIAPALFPQEQTLSIKKADVYKNGSAFITAEGTLNFDQSEATLSFIPKAMFGTLWVYSPDKQVTVTDLKVIQRKNVFSRKCSTMTEILTSNLGKNIIFNRSDDRKNAIQGILQAVSGTDDRFILTMKSNQQTLALSAYWYNAHFEFPGGMNDMTTDTLESQVLKIRTNSGHSNQRMNLMYFMNQLGWVPSYYVDLTDDKSAQIVLTATLINDAADMENVELNFVVGFPNFIYHNVESPLSNKAAINDFMRSLSGAERRPSYQSLSNIAAQSFVAYDSDDRTEFNYSESGTQEGISEEDLFFYPAPKITLKKGERGIYQIFSATVPYAHIYEVSLPNHLNHDKYSREEAPQVWHSVKLENKTANPWTTGSGMTLRNGKALGMDILKYTPKGSSGKLKITASPDIQVSDDEKEIERKQDYRKKSGYYYDLVKIEGEILVRNYKDQPVTLMITKSVSGKILDAGTGAKIKQIPGARDVINADNLIEWETRIKPGETGKINYQYEVFLRH